MADKVYKITFTLTDGSKKSVQFTVPQGDTGPQGPAYTLTSADKTTIVNAVKAAMPACIPAVLTSEFYGDTLPQAGTPGRIFFKRVTE